MTKKISLLLIAIMIVNILAFVRQDVVFAATTESFADYTMSDVAYSDTLQLFVATGNKAGKGAAFASHDGEVWAKVAQFPVSIGSGERDSIVWWESQGVFVIYMGPSATIYTSGDGYSWELTSIPDLATGGGITIDGDGYLLHFHGESILKVYQDFKTYDTYIFTTYKGSNASIAFSGGTGSTKTTFVVSQFRGGGSWDGGKTWSNIDSFASAGTVKDSAFSTVQDCFFMAVTDGNGKTVFKIERLYKQQNRDNKDNPTLSAKINSLTIANGQLVVGLKTGRFYKTPDVAGAEMDKMVFTEMTATGTNYIPSLPKRFAYGNNKLVALCNTDSGLPNSKGQIVVFNEAMTSFKAVLNYNTTPYLIKSEGGKRFEVPAASQAAVTKALSFTITDLTGNPVQGDSIDTVTASLLPSGVSFANGTFTIQPNAASGTAVITVKTMNGLSESFNITFVKESYVVIEGTFEIAIPAYGAPPEDWSFTATVYGDDDNPMDRTATISIVSELPTGAEFIADQNIIRLRYDAVAAEYTMKAISNTTPSVFTQIGGTINARTPKSIEFTQKVDSIQIPNEGTITSTYKAMVKDQTNAAMPLETVVWSVKDVQTGKAVPDVTIDNDGILTVANTAYKGNIEITVKLVSETFNISSKVSTALTYTDLRCVTEDIQGLTIAGELSKVKNNLTLAIAGENNTAITWASSNPNIIAINPLGKVTRQRLKDEAVTLIATIKKGSSTKAKTFETTVIKLDNIFSNGDFENNSTNPWKITGNAQLNVDNSVANSGTKSLSITNRSDSTDGVSQVVNLSDNSAYYVEGYVRGSVSNQKINVGAGNAANTKAVSKTVQDNGFTKITCLFTYTKQNKTFDETFKIHSEGTDGFHIDDFRIEEVTLEYDALMAAIVKAEYSRHKDDIAAAKTLLEAFYNIPGKDDLGDRINSIVPKSETSTGGNGGNGGGGGGKSGGRTTAVVTTPVIPDNSETVADHLLIFKDLKGHWAKDHVEFMANNGFVQGKEEGMFEPDVEITRAEFAALAVRVLGAGNTAYQNSFYDVVTEDWYSGIVQSAKNMGLINGSDGLFKPNDPISREEMTKIVVSAYHTKTKTTLPTGGAFYYSDYYNVSSWAYDYVVSAVNLGFVQGISEDVFSPSTHATRAQAVIILKRLYDKISDNKGADKS